MAVGLRTAAAGSIAGIEETSVRALAKLEQVLPARLRRRVSALEPRDLGVRVRRPADRRGGARGARRRLPRRQRAALRLRRRATSARLARQIEPRAVVYSGYRWYLVAFDLDRDDWRTFRIDRISSHPPIRLGRAGAPPNGSRW